MLDLQSNKVDLAFALNPTPARALSIGFTHPMIIHPFGCLAKQGLDPKTWDDLNKPDIRIVFDIGSLHETAARRYCPKAQLTGYKTRDECSLALQSGRADAHILAAILGLAAVGKNPSLGPYHLLGDPDRGAAKLPRRPARAGHAVRRGDQRLARLQSRHRPDPRMAAGGPGEVRRQPRSGAGAAELLTGSRPPAAGGQGRHERMLYHWDFAFLLRYVPLFWSGVLVTLAYTVGTILLGLIIGLLVGLGRLSRRSC